MTHSGTDSFWVKNDTFWVRPQMCHFSFFYFVIDNILYFVTPAGAWTSTIWFFLDPSKAIPIGDSFDILFCNKSASVEPTIVYDTSSSNSSSHNLTVFPTWTVFVSISESSIILAYLTLFSNSAILSSFAACALLASSYSEFSDKSPNPKATFILSAISALFSVLISYFISITDSSHIAGAS